MIAGRWLAAALLAGLLLGCEGSGSDSGGGAESAETAEEGSSPAGQAEGPPSVVGEWAATDPQGSKVRFTFREDDTAVWIFDEQGRSADRVEGRYTVRGSEPPHEIDIHDFQSGPMQGKRFEGIYEMRGAETLMMEGTPGGPRPSAFGEDALEFHRR